ncbi:adenosine deaminase [Fusibacter sp. JL216-2]|uniref:adenosine deaminase n=1 Tax=Fusibacter sp. JL216-2 TaxID=3071453 RepID=UPI003D339A82
MTNLKMLPKVELHCHLDGSVRPETILELAKQDGIELPTYNLEDLKAYLQVPDDCPSLKVYLERFALPNAVMQNGDNIRRITDELLSDVAEDGVKYIEIRFAPRLHMAKGLTFDEIVESVLSAIRTAPEKYGIYANLILCCMRHEDVKHSIEVVKSGRKFLGKGVVAVDLAGNEHDYPPELHKAAFDLAKDYGYHITVHAGETGIGENVEKSIELLHAERIGHGLFCKNVPSSYALVKSKQIPLEMCPVSNLHTKAVPSYAEHPIGDFYKDDVFVTINTDNMTVSNITQTEEYEHLAKNFDFNEDIFTDIYLKSVEASFASNDIKEHLRSLVGK